MATESHREKIESRGGELNKITELIIGCAIEMHKRLGPGFLESTYLAGLNFELSEKGLEVKKQQGLPLIYKEIYLEIGYRLDLLVEGNVVVEIKSVECLTDVHTAQVLTYLKLTNSRVGLLINFNVLRLTEGIKRLIAREH